MVDYETLIASIKATINKLANIYFDPIYTSIMNYLKKHYNPSKVNEKWELFVWDKILLIISVIIFSSH